MTTRNLIVGQVGIVLVLTAMASPGCFPAAKTVLDLIAPAAIDALTQLVSERWGADAEVDEETAGCFRAAADVAELVGDDDQEYVYVVCRAKAVE